MSNEMTRDDVIELKTLREKIAKQRERSGKYWRKYRAEHIAMKKFCRDHGYTDEQLEKDAQAILEKNA